MSARRMVPNYDIFSEEEVIEASPFDVVINREAASSGLTLSPVAASVVPTLIPAAASGGLTSSLATPVAAIGVSPLSLSTPVAASGVSTLSLATPVNPYTFER